MRKRIFAILLTAVMLLGMAPVAAQATVNPPANTGLCYLPIRMDGGPQIDDDVTKYMQGTLSISAGSNRGFFFALYSFDGSTVTAVNSGVSVSSGLTLEKFSERLWDVQCEDNWYYITGSQPGVTGTITAGGGSIDVTIERPNFGLYADQSCSDSSFLDMPTLTGASTTVYLGMDSYGNDNRTITDVQVLHTDNAALAGVTAVVAGNGKTATITFDSSFPSGLNTVKLHITASNSLTNETETLDLYCDIADNRPALVMKWLQWDGSNQCWGEPYEYNYLGSSITLTPQGENGTDGIALYFKDSSGALTPVNAAFVAEKEGIHVRSVSLTVAGRYELYATAFGSGEFTYTYGGDTYTLPVTTMLPEVGVYSGQTATEESYLGITGFTVTGSSRTFYINTIDSNLTFDSVEATSEYEPVTVSRVSDTCYQVEITDNYNGQTWVGFWVEATRGEDGFETGNMQILVSAQLVDGRPGLVFKYLRYTGSGWTDPDPSWEIQKTLYVSPKLNGDGAAGVAVYLRDESNVLTPVSGVSLEGSNVFRVNEISGHPGWYEISATNFGYSRLCYTDKDNNIYTMRLCAVSPEVGIYSRADVWDNGVSTPSDLIYTAFLETTGFTVTKSDRTFYICVRPDTPTPVSVSQINGNFTTITKLSSNYKWQVEINDDYDGEDIAEFLVDYGDGQGDTWIHLFDGRAGGLMWDHISSDQYGTPNAPAGNPSTQPFAARCGFSYVIALTYSDGGSTTTAVTDASAEGDAFRLFPYDGHPGWYILQPDQVGQGCIKATVGGAEYRLEVNVGKTSYDVTVGQTTYTRRVQGYYPVPCDPNGPTTVTIKNNYAQEDPFIELGVQDLQNGSQTITVNGCTVTIVDGETITVTAPAGSGDKDLSFFVGAGSYGFQMNIYLWDAPAVASISAAPTTHTAFTYNGQTYYYGISRLFYDDGGYFAADPYCGGLISVDPRYGEGSYILSQDFYTKNAEGTYEPVDKTTRETLLAASTNLGFTVKATASGYAHGPMVTSSTMDPDYPNAKLVSFYDDSTIGTWAVMASGILPDGTTVLSDVFVGMIEQTPFAIPMQMASRAHVVTALWNMSGRPEHNVQNSPFNDLTGYEEAYDAICWAVENGIVNGTDAGSFEPDASVTRAQLALLLARFNDVDLETYEPGENQLTDINGHWAYKAICWVLENNKMPAANGAGTRFEPDDAITPSDLAYLCEHTGGGHDWQPGDVMKEPTATQPGIQEMRCSICCCYDEQPIAPTGCALSQELFTVDLSEEPYTGGPITKTVTSVIDEQYYEVSYSDNVKMGTATLTITGKEPFSGSVSFTFTIGKAPAATPTDLHWITDADGEFAPGTAVWRMSSTGTGKCEIHYYRVVDGQAQEIFNAMPVFDPGSRASMKDIPLGYGGLDLSSGTYFFTVKELGNGETYTDSLTVRSPDWVYVRPQKQLATPEAPVWDASTQRFTWAASEDALCANYSVNIEYRAEKDGQGRILYSSSARNYFDFGPNHPWFKENGAGYYLIRIQRCLSGDLNLAAHSASGAWSAALYLDDAGKSLADIVTELGDAATLEQVQAAVESVQKLDTDSLAAAIISSDMTGGGEGKTVTEQLSALEDSIKEAGEISTEVAVDGTLLGNFETDKVSIVGAALNPLDEENTEKKLTLKLEQPTSELAIPDQYDGHNCKKFSMGLHGVKDQEKLDVPVKIALPVPDGMATDGLRILHYHGDGTMEVITPRIYMDNGQCMASFVLTSFSDFVMTGERPAIEASNFTVDVSDAVYTGEAVTKTVSSSLREGTDYTVRYENNDQVGTATLIVEGMGSYTGTLRYSFRIRPLEGRTTVIFDGAGLQAGAALYAAAYDGGQFQAMGTVYTQNGKAIAAFAPAAAGGSLTYRLFQLTRGTMKPLAAKVEQ